MGRSGVAQGAQGVWRNLEGRQFQGAPLNRGAKPQRLVAGMDLFGPAALPTQAGGALARRFVIPPFTVLNARDGQWQRRKRMWIRLGCVGTDPLGREVAGLENDKGYAKGNCFRTHTFKGGNAKEMATVSIFDPVLTELSYRWFCPPGGRILDPFAGQSTRGIVAGHLGYDYTGIELREEQIATNEGQLAKLNLPRRPQWIQGDSARIAELMPKGSKRSYDLIFTCPPYFDLEVYSGKRDTDGSAFATYPTFIEWYRGIFHTAVRYLKPNRFLAVVVGEVRDKGSGAYHNFLGDNIRCFLDAGLAYYNEAVLVTAVGSLPVRAGKQFAVSRKMGKTHQNLLVFWKGDPKLIREEVLAWSGGSSRQNGQ